MGEQVIRFIHEFFAKGKFVKSLNQTFLVLVPKKNSDDTFDSFGPISLCNFSYKIIAKLIAERIRPILRDIILPYLSAFVSGWWNAKIPS